MKTDELSSWVSTWRVTCDDLAIFGAHYRKNPHGNSSAFAFLNFNGQHGCIIVSKSGHSIEQLTRSNNRFFRNADIIHPESNFIDANHF